MPRFREAEEFSRGHPEQLVKGTFKPNLVDAKSHDLKRRAGRLPEEEGCIPPLPAGREGGSSRGNAESQHLKFC